MEEVHGERVLEGEEQIEDGRGEEGEEAQNQDGQGEDGPTDPATEPRTATSAPTPAAPDTADARRTWFSQLNSNTTRLMHQLLRTPEDRTGGRAPMRWEDFLQLMRAMGFTYDVSQTGSSFRFNPPNENDRPITFHKPHPDPTLQPIMLREMAKKLNRYYGWNEEDLLRI